MDKETDVAFVILNWNGKDFIEACLQSVFAQTYKKFKVIVVDNGSTDGSVELIQEKYPEVQLIPLNKNLGFGKGMNIGIKKALEDEEVKYIILLNYDIKLDKQFLSEIVKYANNEKVGICAPKMLRMDNPRIIDSTGHVFSWGRIIDRGYNEIDKGQYDNRKDIVGACSGACLYKREMLEDIGLFDESYFVYYEDAELSWRAYNRGWKATFVPTAIVYHGRKSAMKKDKDLAYKLKYLAHRNMITTVIKHGSGSQKLMFTGWLIKEAGLSFVQRILGRVSLRIKFYIRGIIRIWSSH